MWYLDFYFAAYNLAFIFSHQFEWATNSSTWLLWTHTQNPIIVVSVECVYVLTSMHMRSPWNAEVIAYLLCFDLLNILYNNFSPPYFFFEQVIIFTLSCYGAIVTDFPRLHLYLSALLSLLGGFNDGNFIYSYYNQMSKHAQQ